jgi:hypothetical protein
MELIPAAIHEEVQMGKRQSINPNCRPLAMAWVLFLTPIFE